MTINQRSAFQKEQGPLRRFIRKPLSTLVRCVAVRIFKLRTVTRAASDSESPIILVPRCSDSEAAEDPAAPGVLPSSTLPPGDPGRPRPLGRRPLKLHGPSESPLSSPSTPARLIPVRSGQVRSGQVRYITRPKSRTMRVTRQLMLPPSTVT
jgi:hypothetical protein